MAKTKKGGKPGQGKKVPMGGMKGTPKIKGGGGM